MKRITVILVALMLLFTVPVLTQAAEKEIKVIVNNKEVFFPDQKPYLDENGRTMVPVRFVSESLGADVEWDGLIKQVKVQYGKRQVVLRIGQNQAQVDGLIRTFDTKAVIKNSRTMVPLRFISEALGAEVGWMEASSTVSVDLGTNGYTLPPKGSSELVVDIPFPSENTSEVDISFGVKLWLPVEPQYVDLQSILASKFGNEAAQGIVNYIKEKKTDWDELSEKYWILNGQMVRVISSSGQMSISIIVWQPGVKF